MPSSSTPQAGARDVKSHAWFSGLDWAALFDHTITAPLQPVFGSRGGGSGDDADTSNFDPYPDPIDETPLPSELSLSLMKDPFVDF
jgi:hypothetical protein